MRIGVPAARSQIHRPAVPIASSSLTTAPDSFLLLACGGAITVPKLLLSASFAIVASA
jgi:hypothetical protein